MYMYNRAVLIGVPYNMQLKEKYRNGATFVPLSIFLACCHPYTYIVPVLFGTAIATSFYIYENAFFKFLSSVYCVILQ